MENQVKETNRRNRARAILNQTSKKSIAHHQIASRVKRNKYNMNKHHTALWCVKLSWKYRTVQIIHLLSKMEAQKSFPRESCCTFQRVLPLLPLSVSYKNRSCITLQTAQQIQCPDQTLGCGEEKHSNYTFS